MRSSYIQEVKAIFRLSAPVMIAQISQTAITFVDTIMAGHYSAAALSGVAIGSSIWLPTIFFGVGLLSVLTPIIANLNGAAKREQIANYTRHGLIIATILSVIMMLFLYHADKVIVFRSDTNSPIDPEMTYIAVHFLRAIMWGVPGFLFFLVYRFQCEGLANTKPAMYIMLFALIANIPINYIFIYGKFGIPEFGGVGCGITATIIFWLMFILMKGFTLMTPTQKDIRQSIVESINFQKIKQIIVLGFPLALAYFCEVSLFSIIALMLAPLGKSVVSAHQIIFTISSMTFTIPLSIGAAICIRVGYTLGKGNIDATKQIAKTGLMLSFLLALCIALILILFRSFFISWFTSDETIIAICMQLIILLAIYQLSDYLQVTASNILRGYKDTKSIFYISLTAYWLLGLPCGYILALTNIITPPMGAAGFWIGIIIGLTFAAIFFIIRMSYIQTQAGSQKSWF